MRPLGQITDDLEPLLYEILEDHELQRYEVVALINDFIKVHYPDALENPTEGGKFIIEYKHVKEVE